MLFNIFLKRQRVNSYTHIQHLLCISHPPEIRDVMQHLFKEDLDLVRFVVEENSGHCICSSVCAFKLVGTQLSFEVCKDILHGRELGRMTRVEEHLNPLFFLNNLHDPGTLVGK